MHSAPSVSYPVRRSRSVRRLLMGAWCAGAAIAALAAWQMQDAGWRAALLALGVLVSGLALRHGMSGSRAFEGVLHFDGAGWSMSGSSSGSVGFATRAEVCLDFQTVLLLRLRVPGQATSWLWLERDCDPAHWPDLRRAAYSRPPMSGDGVGPAGGPATGISSFSS